MTFNQSNSKSSLNLWTKYQAKNTSHELFYLLYTAAIINLLTVRQYDNILLFYHPSFQPASKDTSPSTERRNCNELQNVPIIER